MIRLDEGLLRRLKIQAAIEGVTMKELAEGAIKRLLDERAKAQGAPRSPQHGGGAVKRRKEP